jgi:hypothetical protein
MCHLPVIALDRILAAISDGCGEFGIAEGRHESGSLGDNLEETKGRGILLRGLTGANA